MSTNFKALYYPFIHFKSDGWVKVAALYWDKLGRIVPEGFETEDSPTVSQFKSFVERYSPAWVRPQFGESFVEFINEQARKLRENYAIELRGSWPVIPEGQRPPSAAQTQPDPRLGYVYFEKMPEDLRSRLVASGLASIHELHNGRRMERWVGMHPRLASVYMTALAEQLAAEQGLRPLTDETRDHLAISSFSIERMAQALLGDVKLVDSAATATETETLLVSIAFRSVVPKGVETLSVEKILEFREKYPGERARFQAKLADFLKAREWLASIPDRKALSDRLGEEYRKILEPSVAELEEKLRQSGIDTMWACFNVKTALPGALGGAISTLTTVVNPVAAGVSGFALGAIAAFRDKRKGAQELLRSTPETYLYRMKQDLNEQGLVDRIKSQAREFALGV